MALTSPRLATLNRLYQGAMGGTGLFLGEAGHGCFLDADGYLRILCAARGRDNRKRCNDSKYVCHPIYYEGRHIDMQVIFSAMAKASDSKGKTLPAAAKLFRHQGHHGTPLPDIITALAPPPR